MVLISNSSHFRTKNCLIASVKIKRPFIAKKNGVEFATSFCLVIMNPDRLSMIQYV